MKLSKLLLLALATTATSLFAQTSTINLPDTGAGGAGNVDPNWFVYKFSSTSGLNVVTGAPGLNTYLAALNNSTVTTVATARDATPFSSSWVTPTATGATWLSIQNSGIQAAHDQSGGGGYAFVYNLGAAFSGVNADFSNNVALSFRLNGDNGFSAHLTSLLGTQFVGGPALLGSTASNFNSVSGVTVSYTGLVSQTTSLVILLSNDVQPTGNPGGILVQDFSGSYTAVPEPSTYAMVLGAMTLGLVGWRRFRK